MGEPRVGDEFIKHEFEKAIAIHGGIVQAEAQLRSLGEPIGATGETEEVAGSMLELIARARKDIELRDAATGFERGQREGAKTLADSLAALAVEIARPETPLA